MKAQVRFPNDDYYFDIEIERMTNFKPEKEFDKSMFGWWGDTYVEVLKIESKNEEGDTIYVSPF